LQVAGCNFPVAACGPRLIFWHGASTDRRGARGGGEDVCPTTAGFTIGQLVLFFSFPAFKPFSRRCLLPAARCSVSWGQPNNLNGQRVWKSCKRSLCDGNADDADEQEEATTVRGNQR